MNAADHRLKRALDLSAQLMGARRHLGQHPGGFVLPQDRLDDLVPIEPASTKDRHMVEWDKNDIEALKFMKFDVLALGMLTCMAKSETAKHFRKTKEEAVRTSLVGRLYRRYSW